MSSDVSPADSALPGLDDRLVEPELPDLDDRLVEPETRYEMLDGELVYVPPADPPHANRQLQLSALVEAHTEPEFEAGCELLTRTSKIDDFAPDVSVYPAAPHPRTGRRQLQQLAFEVVSTQSLRNAGRKAAKLIGRGVRRVFAIDVERSRALEWSTERGAWVELDAAGHIDDPALAVPLPIAELIHDAKADDAIARALVVRRNPVIEAVRAQDREEGKAEGTEIGLAGGRAAGKAEAVIMVLATRGIVVDPATRERVLGERDLPRLDRWIVRAATCTTIAELFVDA